MARRALIAGAGIGGLTAALALARRGFSVEVFERAPALLDFGAGIQLSPNATRILARLDALEGIRAAATEPSAIRLLRGADGGEIARLPLDDAERRWGAPYFIVHRADLQKALVEAVSAQPAIALRLGVAGAGIGLEDEGVAVGLKRGLTTMRES
ncbi:MAG: NAD(P)-binding protein, partial [Hyphomicrobiales bacterium]|nr:NAD(P)-binding protein [Hyphomicrobiales bacterium]